MNWLDSCKNGGEAGLDSVMAFVSSVRLLSGKVHGGEEQPEGHVSGFAEKRIRVRYWKLWRA